MTPNEHDGSGIKKLKEEEQLRVRKHEARLVVPTALEIVQQLVENSIDAGSKEIGVEIGKSITVFDDGCGIHWEDAPQLCRYGSTSKVRRKDEISTATTAGFRGGSLAALSHLMKLTVTSKTPTAELGWRATYYQEETRTAKQGDSPFLTIAAKQGTKVVAAKGEETDKESIRKIERQIQFLDAHYKNIRFSIRSRCTKWSSPRLKDQSAAEMIARTTEGDLEGVKYFSGVSTQYQSRWSGRYSRHDQGPEGVYINNQFIIWDNLMRRLPRTSDDRPHTSFYLAMYVHPSYIDRNVDPRKQRVAIKDEESIIDEIITSMTTPRHDLARTGESLTPVQSKTASSVDTECDGLFQETLPDHVARLRPFIGKLKFKTVLPGTNQLVITYNNRHGTLPMEQVLTSYFRYLIYQKEHGNPILSLEQPIHMTALLKRATPNLLQEPVELDVDHLCQVFVENNGFLESALHVSIDTIGFLKGIPIFLDDVSGDVQQLPGLMRALAERLCEGQPNNLVPDCLSLMAKFSIASITRAQNLESCRNKCKSVFQRMQQRAVGW